MTEPLDDARGEAILAAELRGSTAEFLGWLTGLVPPSEKENIPPEMRPAFDKMVGRLTEASKRYANTRPAPVPQCDAESGALRKALEEILACGSDHELHEAFIRARAALSPDPGTVAAASAQYRCTCGAEPYCAPNVHAASCPLAISSTDGNTP